MRQKRAKTYKRVMALYTQTFGFRTPFQMLGAYASSWQCPASLCWDADGDSVAGHPTEMPSRAEPRQSAAGMCAGRNQVQ